MRLMAPSPLRPASGSKRRLLWNASLLTLATVVLPRLANLAVVIILRYLDGLSALK